MTNAAVAKSVDELRRKIENLNTVGSKNHSPWLEKVLELNDKTAPKENKIISPGDYLDKANYTGKTTSHTFFIANKFLQKIIKTCFLDVVERDYGPPFKTIRICVTSKDEEDKCRTLSKVAFSRNIRPRFDCVLEDNVHNCLKTIRDNGADIITLDGEFNLLVL